MPLDRSQLEDLRRIASTDPDKLSVVVDRLRELKPDPLSRSGLYSAAREALAGDGQTADCFIRQALLQFWPIRRHGVSVQEVLDFLKDTLRAEPSWNEQDQEKWSRVEPVFGDLLSLEIVRLV